MKKILIILMFLITYGSLYPFDFSMPVIKSDMEISIFFASLAGYSKGDLLQNVLLFIPLGFVGPFLRSPSGKKLPDFVYAVVFLSFGFMFAIFVQILQIYVPSRVPGLGDSFVNLAGSIVGYIGGLFFKKHAESVHTELRVNDIFIMILLSSWVAYKLFPFIPTIDWQNIKNGLKPLLLNPDFEILSFVGNTISVYLIGYLFHKSSMKQPTLYYVFFVYIVLGLQVFFIDVDISINEVLGAIVAMILWFGSAAYVRAHHALLVLLFTAMLIFYFLYPFGWLPHYHSFSFVPFSGFLTGSIEQNFLNLFLKVFLYGGLLKILWDVPLRPFSALMVTGFIVGGIEFMQIFMSPDHSPEITDPLLVVLIYYLIPKENQVIHFTSQTSTEVLLSTK